MTGTLTNRRRVGGKRLSDRTPQGDATVRANKKKELLELGRNDQARASGNKSDGIQAKYLLPEFQKLGHAVAQHAWSGLMGGVLNWGGMPIYPMGMDPYGNDIVEKHAAHFEADIVISLMDVWVLHQYGKKQMRWIPYMPIDHDPIPPKVLSALEGAYKVVSYAKYGERALNAAGIANTMIPHGVDCSVYTPTDKRAAKQQLGFDPDAFVIGMVAANKGFPSRKCFPENLQAVAQFKAAHPGVKVHLYLHTLENTAQGGVDLNLLLQNLGFQAGEVTFCNQYKYISGMLGHEYMADAYNAMDVLLAASMSEGFGIPLIEAQACGTPVIAGDYTSMRELVFAGAAVPYAQRFWTPMNAWNYLPSVEAIGKALEGLYECRDNAQMRETARAGALAYDWSVIVKDYWRPFLEEVETQIAAERNLAC